MHRFIFMKFAILPFLFTIFYLSGPRIAQSNSFGSYSYDNLYIHSTYPVKMGKVSDEYFYTMRQEIDSFYTDSINCKEYSGGFIVVKNGRVIYEDYQGFSDAAAGKKIDAFTPIHLASISKVLTTSAILRLVQQDNLLLDQKVTDWLSKFPYPETTIRTLLNHRSGIQHYSKFPTLLKKKWDKKKIVTNEDIFNFLVENKIGLKYPNDTHFEYCNTNYIILALIIEKATGLSYQKAMQELVFKPLGMTNSYVFNYYTDIETASKSYKGNSIYPWNQFDALYGDKNIYSTPRDMVKFDLATYSPDYIKHELLEEAYKGYSSFNIVNPTSDYGLGMRMKFLPPNGEKMIYHNGWWHGNNTSFIPIRKDTVTVVCLGNRASDKPYATMKLAKKLFYKNKSAEEMPDVEKEN